MRVPSVLLLAALLGCQPIAPKPDSGILRFESEDPSLTGLAVTCDQTEGRWSIDVRADAWVGTARLWMATRPTVIEQHELGVKRSAADATWDCFDHSMSMATDLGDPGSGTRFRCTDRTDLYMLVAISEATSSRWTDCAVWGPDEDYPWAEDNAVPDCPNTLTDVFTPDTFQYSLGDVAACE